MSEWNLLPQGDDMNEGQDQEVSGPVTLEKVRDAVAETMHKTAHTIHDQLRSDRPEASKPAEWGLRTSEWLDRLSEEVRQWDVRGSDSRLRAAIANHPGGALLLAGAAGILLGRALRRR